jgi:hypothetical protein
MLKWLASSRKDLASDQIAFGAFKNDFVKSSETVFQNGYAGADPPFGS